MTTVDYVLCDRSSGRIVATGKCRTDRLRHLSTDSLRVIIGRASDVRHYIDPESGEILERTALPLDLSAHTIEADGVATVLVTGIPAGALCWITGPVPVAPWIETTGVLRVTTNLAGAYRLAIDHPHHLVAYIDIEALR